jgi:DNA-binding Xre family transcriptional regulator
MIKIKIAELAGKHGLKTAYALQKALDMPPTMASRLYKGDFDKIGIGTIEKLCAYFGCQPDAFLEYPFAPVNHTQASNTQTSNDVARPTQLSNTELCSVIQASDTQLDTSKYYNKSELKRRGWTTGMIKDLYGEPDFLYPQQCGNMRPKYYYLISNIEAIEKTKAFKERKQKNRARKPHPIINK